MNHRGYVAVLSKLTLRFISITLCLVASACTSLACTCMHRRQDPAGAFTAASSVFFGEVIEITERESSSLAPGIKDLAVKFRIEKSWKLVRKNEVTVSTVNTSSLCGFPFSLGGKYLVYAYGVGTALNTDICTRTGLLTYAKEDLEYLKRKRLLKGKKNVDLALRSLRRESCNALTFTSGPGVN